MKEIKEAERVAIGKILKSLLMDDSGESTIQEVVEKLEPKHFENLIYRNIYSAVLSLYNQGKNIDFTGILSETVTEELPEEIVSEAIRKCTVDTITTAGLQNDIEAILNNYKWRKAKEICSSAGRNNLTVDERISEVINQLSELMQGIDNHDQTLAEIVKENECNHFTPDKKERLNLGFNSLDKVIGGLDDTDLFVIGARPSTGKSAYALNVALNIAKTGKKVYFFGMEMSKQQIYERLVSSESKIEMSRIRSAKEFRDIDERQDFIFANQRLMLENLIISDSSGLKPSDVRRKCKNVPGLKVIIIDYLQLMVSDRRNDNKTAEIGYISMALKQIASDLHIPIIILSQLNRAVETRQDPEPKMSDLRESGQIEQDANIIGFLYNTTTEDSDSAERIRNGSKEEQQYVKGFSIAKNRQGITGKVYYKFNGSIQTFYECDMSGKTEYSESYKKTEWSKKPKRYEHDFLNVTDYSDLPFN